METKRKVVLADGNFDGLHFGHIRHLQEAALLGDMLIVVLATDDAVTKQKGPTRPRFPLAERIQMLRLLPFVNDIIPTDDSLALVEKIKPDIYVKGKEYQDVDHPTHAKMVALVQSHGGIVHYTDTMLASSSQLIAKFYNITKPIDREPAEVLAWIDKSQSLTVTVVGERILDRYIFVKPSGKSPKENYITYINQTEETWLGGAEIIRRNIEQMGCIAHIRSGSQIEKIRYVSEPFGQKLFSTVIYPTSTQLRSLVPDNDLVIAADFGHGLFDQIAIVDICQNTKFLALTVQSNSLNWGFNLLHKWPRADYFVIDEPELNLNWEGHGSNITRLKDSMAAMKTKMAVLTLGHEGCVISDGQETIKLPALANKIVDRMGAGDAFLAWSAPLACLGAPMDIVAFVGSVAAGIKVGKLGNEVVTMEEMVAWIKGLLK